MDWRDIKEILKKSWKMQSLILFLPLLMTTGAAHAILLGWSGDLRLSCSGTGSQIIIDSEDNVHFLLGSQYIKLNEQGGLKTKSLQIGSNPNFAMDSTGNIYISAYATWRTGAKTIKFTKLDNNGEVIEKDVRLVKENLDTNNPTSMDVAPSGDSFLVWQAPIFPGGGADALIVGYVFHYTKLNATGGVESEWQKSIRKNKVKNNYQVVSDSMGNFHVVEFIDEGKFERKYISYKKFDKNGRIITDVEVAELNESQNLSVAIDSKGRVHVAWQDRVKNEYDTVGKLEIFYMQFDSSGKILVNKTRMTFHRNGAENPDLTIDSKDNIHLVWQDKRDGDFEIYHKKLNADGMNLTLDTRLTFREELIPLSEDHVNSINPSIAIDSKDNIHVVWEVNEVYYSRSGTAYTTNRGIYYKTNDFSHITDEPSLIIGDTSRQFSPTIYGDKFVFVNFSGPNGDIHLFDFEKSTNEKLLERAGQIYDITFHADKVVWEKKSRDDRDMVVFNLSSGRVVKEISSPSFEQKPKIYHNKIVWRGYGEDYSGIYLYDFSSGIQKEITSDISKRIHYGPLIQNDKVFWIQCSLLINPKSCALYIYDLSLDKEIIYESINGTSTISISNDVGVWLHTNNTGTDFYLINLNTGQKTSIFYRGGDISHLTLHEDRLVWQENLNCNNYVFMYELYDGILSCLNYSSDPKESISIYGDRIVWLDLKIVDEIPSHYYNIFYKDLAPQKRLTIIANSIDKEFATGLIKFFENKDVEISYAKFKEVESYKNEKFLLILGGPDATGGVGDIVKEVLTNNEQNAIRKQSTRKMYVKTNSWAQGQKIVVVAGSNREETKASHQENQNQILSEAGF